MKAIIPIVCVALLAACAPQGESNPPDEAAERVGSEVPDLTGHYQITALGNEPLPFTLEISANTNSIWWEPACSGQGLSYRPAAKGKVEFFDPSDPDVPQIVCDIGYPEELTKLWARLKGMHEVELRADRSMMVHVEGERWLFEPTTDPLPDDLTGTWRVEEIGGLSTVEMRTLTLQADGKEIWWSPRCVGTVLRYEMEGQLVQVMEPSYAPSASSGGGKSAPIRSAPDCVVRLSSDQAAAMTALRGAERVTRDHRNNLVLSGPQSRIVLSKTSDPSNK